MLSMDEALHFNGSPELVSPYLIPSLLPPAQGTSQSDELPDGKVAVGRIGQELDEMVTCLMARRAGAWAGQFYNSTRRHSMPGYVSPVKFESLKKLGLLSTEPAAAHDEPFG